MKIPVQAKLIFKGIIFDIYQWEQTLFDGSTATFEMVKRPNTSQIIATRNNKIIIAEEEQPNKPPFLSLLGGRQENNESALEGAQRELLEEGGLKSTDWELIKTYNQFGKIDWEINLYVARNVEQVTDQNLDKGEKIKLREVTFEEFCELVLEPQFYGQELTRDFWEYKAKGGEKFRELKKKLGLV